MTTLCNFQCTEHGRQSQVLGNIPQIGECYSMQLVYIPVHVKCVSISMILSCISITSQNKNQTCT